MADILTGTALFVLLVSAAGLVAILRSRIAIEKMMAVQLLGTGGSTILMLFGAASRQPALFDVSLLLVLLSAFSCAGFAIGESKASDSPCVQDEPS